MNRFFTLMLISTGLLAMDNCEVMLSRSIQTTENCLNTLYSLENIGVADSGRLLGSPSEIEHLRVENTRLKKENRELKREVAATKLRVKTLARNLDEQKSKYTELLLDFEKIKYKTLARLHKGGSSNIYEESKFLDKRFKGYDQASLIEEKAYRVPTHMLNIRSESSGMSSIAGVLLRGDLVRFFDAKKKSVKGRAYYWLQTKNGWIYVPDASSKDIKVSLDEFLSEKSTKGGEKG